MQPRRWPFSWRVTKAPAGDSRRGGTSGGRVRFSPRTDASRLRRAKPSKNRFSSSVSGDIALGRLAEVKQRLPALPLCLPLLWRDAHLNPESAEVLQGRNQGKENGQPQGPTAQGLQQRESDSQDQRGN